MFYELAVYIHKITLSSGVRNPYNFDGSQESLGYFIAGLEVAFSTFAIQSAVQGKLDNSWNSFHKAMLEFDKKVAEAIKSPDDFIGLNRHHPSPNNYDDILRIIAIDSQEPPSHMDPFSKWWKAHYKGSMMRALQAFSPQKNDIKVMKITDKLPVGRECWTDAKCLMVHFALDQFGYDIQEFMREMVDAV